MAKEDVIQGAITAVNNGQSLRKASEEWGVPYATLWGRIKAYGPRSKQLARQDA